MRDLKTIKEEIMVLVREYSSLDTGAAASHPYVHGERIQYAGRVYDENERVNLIDASLKFWLTAGEYADKFEKMLSEYLNVPYCYACNSGSSANLLAFFALTSPLLKERAIKRGDEVITVAAAFPTTVAPIVQYGAIPVFVDVTIPQYNIDVTKLEAARSSKTKAIFIAHTLGNPFDLRAVKDFCDDHNLWLIEDTCDAIGGDYDMGAGFQKVGTIGDIGTLSCYPAHHITMGEGGAVWTKDSLLAKCLLSFRDWGRDCTCPSGKDNTCGHRFDRQYGTLPQGYDHKFVYSHLGFNLKVTDLQAAIGVAQLEKLPNVVEARRNNWEKLKEGLNSLRDYLLLPEKAEYSIPSPFGFLMTVKENSPVSCQTIVETLEKNNIQTRRLFSGNITRHPCFTSLVEGVDYRIVGDLRNTDRIMQNTFWVGVYPGIDGTRRDAIIDTIKGCFDF